MSRYSRPTLENVPVPSVKLIRFYLNIGADILPILFTVWISVLKIKFQIFSYGKTALTILGVIIISYFVFPFLSIKIFIYWKHFLPLLFLCHHAERQQSGLIGWRGQFRIKDVQTSLFCSLSHPLTLAAAVLLPNDICTINWSKICRVCSTQNCRHKLLWLLRSQ